MKKIVFLFVMLLTSVMAGAQTWYKAVINDPDGYTFVRKGQSTETDVVQRIYDGEEFVCQKGATNWWPVYTKKNGSRIGYIHKSRVNIIGQATTEELSAADASEVKGIATELLQKVVKSNNDCFDRIIETDDDDIVIPYSTSHLQSIISKYKIIVKKEMELSEKGVKISDDTECYFGGDGNHCPNFYILHNGDDKFCPWDEVSKILKWEIVSVEKTSIGALVKVSLYQKSCYENTSNHTYISKIMFARENGKWKVSDFNGYLSEEETEINRIYKEFKL